MSWRHSNWLPALLLLCALLALALASGITTPLAGRIYDKVCRKGRQLVATGEAPLGIVYATDAKAEKAVKVLATFPAASHPPIVYPAGALAAAADKDLAQKYLAFLRSPQAQAIFGENGFQVPTPTN